MTISTFTKASKIRIRGSFYIPAAIADEGVDTPDDPSAVVLVARDAELNMQGYHVGLQDQGDWDADENNPELEDGTGTVCDCYTVTVAGSVDFGHGEIEFAVGDVVFYNGYVWSRLPAPATTGISRADTGVYDAYLYLATEGEWVYRMEGMGDLQAVSNGKFLVATDRTSQ